VGAAMGDVMIAWWLAGGVGRNMARMVSEG